MTTSSITEILKGVDPAALQAQIKEHLADLTALTKDLDAGKTAIDLLRLANQEAIALLSISMPPAEAVEKWFTMSWEERIALLEQMKSQALKPVTDLMTKANDNIKVKTFLLQALNVIAIPADQIAGYGQLIPLLEELSQKKLALATDRPPASKESIAIIKTGGTTIYYLPNPMVPISRASWYVLKQAETRAKQVSEKAKTEEKKNRQRALGLRAKTTPGVGLMQILEGKEGDYCLFLAHGHGALIRFIPQPESLRVEFLETTQEFSWNSIVVSRDGEFRTLRKQWPSDEYAALLQKNLQREKEAKTQTQRRGEEPSPRISEILSLATLPEAGGVTRLLKGETGVAVAYCQGFQQPNGDKGLISVALERQHEESDCLYLKEALSDHPYLDFESLKGKPLPPIACEEKTGRVEYTEHISGFSPAAYRALTVLRVVLQMAVNAERQNQAQS